MPIIEINADIIYYIAMIDKKLPELSGNVIYFVGIKGTGMTALAEIFRARGAIVTGSDVEERFYTDDILHGLGIHVFEGFSEDNLPQSAKLLVYSAAYSPDEHPEIVRAKELGIDILSYAEALGLLSGESIAAGISGVHGKTTTAAIAGTVFGEFDLAFSVLTGSAAANFCGKSTLIRGHKYFIAETCEYKRHFLNFHPDYLVITSIEADHLDYFYGLDDVINAFVEYAERLPKKGTLIYCADDAGAVKAVGIIGVKRPDIVMVPYGFKAEGDFRITGYEQLPGEQRFFIKKYGSRDFTIKIPGRHNVLNSTAVAALLESVLYREGDNTDPYAGIAKGLAGFRGTKRRSELIGEAEGVLIMDD